MSIRSRNRRRAKRRGAARTSPGMSTVAALSVKITANVTEFEKGIAAMQRSLDQTGSRFKSIGSKLTAGLTLPVRAAGNASEKTAAEFEASMAEVAEYVDERQESIRRGARRTDHRFTT